MSFYRLIGFCLFGCFITHQVNSASLGDALILDVNTSQKNFMITLDANASTGFQWSLVKFDKKLLALDKSQYVKPQQELIGAGGQMTYIFSLNNGQKYPPKTQMIFKYSRSWEPQTALVKQVTIRSISK